MTNQSTQRKKYSTQYLAQIFLWFYCPSLYMHRSHVDSKIPYKLFYRLLGKDSLAKRNHYRLSRFFSEYKPESIDVKTDLWSFVTMSNYHLDYVVRMTAALEIGNRIRSTVSGAENRHLRKIFGDDVVTFVCRRHAGFYKGGLLWQNIDFNEINEKLIGRLGWAFLYHARLVLPPNMLGIWLMRLPKTVDLASIDSRPTSEEAFRLCASLFKEVSHL